MRTDCLNLNSDKKKWEAYSVSVTIFNIDWGARFSGWMEMVPVFQEP